MILENFTLKKFVVRENDLQKVAYNHNFFFLYIVSNNFLEDYSANNGMFICKN